MAAFTSAGSLWNTAAGTASNKNVTVAALDRDTGFSLTRTITENGGTTSNISVTAGTVN
jgi:hypothetical protein